MNNRENAFTILELIIAIALIGIIITAIFSFYFNGKDVFSFSREKIRYQRDQRLIEKWVASYTRKAIEIDDNPIGDDEIRILYDAEGNEDGIGFGIDSDGYFYYHKRIGGSWGTNKKITTLTGKNLSFSYMNNMLTINFTLINKDGDKEYSFSSKYYPRYPDATTP